MTTRGRLVAIAALIAGAAHADGPVVLADIPAVASIVAGVTEGMTVPELITEAGDPHHGALRPSEARALSQAEVIFWVGPDLTPWLARIMDELGQEEMRLVALQGIGGQAGSGVEDDHGHGREHAEGGEADHAEEGEHTDHAASGHRSDPDGEGSGLAHGYGDHADPVGERRDSAEHDHAVASESDARAHGHSHEFDPHYWLDPVRAMAWTRAVADIMAEVDPANAERYRGNATNRIAALEEVLRDVEAILGNRTPRYILDHEALTHFEARFGIGRIAALADGDADRPGPRRVADTRRAARDGGAICLVVETSAPPRTPLDGLRRVEVDLTGATFEPGPELYRQLLVDLARKLADCTAEGG